MKQQTHKYLNYAWKAVAGLAIVALIIWINTQAAQNESIAALAADFGYLGIFGVSAVSGFNIFLPIPIVSFFPFFMDVGFAPVATIAAITAGMTLGDLLGFLIGNKGRAVVSSKQSHKILAQIQKLREKHWFWPLLVLFFYAGFVPLPNELIVIPMAFLGFRLRAMIIALFFGNCMFNIVGAFGLTQLIG